MVAADKLRSSYSAGEAQSNRLPNARVKLNGVAAIKTSTRSQTRDRPCRHLLRPQRFAAAAAAAAFAAASEPLLLTLIAVPAAAAAAAVAVAVAVDAVCLAVSALRQLALLAAAETAGPAAAPAPATAAAAAVYPAEFAPRLLVVVVQAVGLDFDGLLLFSYAENRQLLDSKPPQFLSHDLQSIVCHLARSRGRIPQAAVLHNLPCVLGIQGEP